jgi:hypothetical protein
MLKLTSDNLLRPYRQKAGLWSEPGKPEAFIGDGSRPPASCAAISSATGSRPPRRAIARYAQRNPRTGILEGQPHARREPRASALRPRILLPSAATDPTCKRTRRIPEASTTRRARASPSVSSPSRDWSRRKGAFKTRGQDPGIRFIPLREAGYEKYSVYFPVVSATSSTHRDTSP